MKISRFTDSQIMAILKQNEAGASVPDLCRELELNLRGITLYVLIRGLIYMLHEPRLPTPRVNL